jgi:hypothetical protein
MLKLYWFWALHFFGVLGLVCVLAATPDSPAADAFVSKDALLGGLSAGALLLVALGYLETRLGGHAAEA